MGLKLQVGAFGMSESVSLHGERGESLRKTVGRALGFCRTKSPAAERSSFVGVVPLKPAEVPWGEEIAALEKAVAAPGKREQELQVLRERIGRTLARASREIILLGTLAESPERNRAIATVQQRRWRCIAAAVALEMPLLEGPLTGSVIADLSALDRQFAATNTPGYSFDRLLGLLCNHARIRELSALPLGREKALEGLAAIAATLRESTELPRDGFALNSLIGRDPQLDDAIAAVRVRCFARFLEQPDSVPSDGPWKDAQELVRRETEIAQARQQLMRALRGLNAKGAMDSVSSLQIDNGFVKGLHERFGKSRKVGLLLAALRERERQLVLSPEAARLIAAIDRRSNEKGACDIDQKAYLEHRRRTLMESEAKTALSEDEMKWLGLDAREAGAAIQLASQGLASAKEARRALDVVNGVLASWLHDGGPGELQVEALRMGRKDGPVRETAPRSAPSLGDLAAAFRESDASTAGNSVHATSVNVHGWVPVDPTASVGVAFGGSAGASKSVDFRHTDQGWEIWLGSGKSVSGQATGTLGLGAVPGAAVGATAFASGGASGSAVSGVSLLFSPDEAGKAAAGRFIERLGKLGAGQALTFDDLAGVTDILWRETKQGAVDGAVGASAGFDSSLTQAGAGQPVGPVAMLRARLKAGWSRGATTTSNSKRRITRKATVTSYEASAAAVLALPMQTGLTGSVSPAAHTPLHAGLTLNHDSLDARIVPMSRGRVERDTEMYRTAHVLPGESGMSVASRLGGRDFDEILKRDPLARLEVRELVAGTGLNEVIGVGLQLEESVRNIANAKFALAEDLRQGVSGTNSRAARRAEAASLEKEAEALIADAGNYIVVCVRREAVPEAASSKTPLNLGVVSASRTEAQAGSYVVANVFFDKGMAAQVRRDRLDSRTETLRAAAGS